MSRMILAHDLGTGGNKASVYDSDGHCHMSAFVSYETVYSKSGWHEQRPEDWWNAIVESTRTLLDRGTVAPAEISSVAVSGQSLSVVPLDIHGRLRRETTPIWSDGRAHRQAERFFANVDEAFWYSVTGNGFPPHLYSVFKLMWYAENEPNLLNRTHKFLGSKDYINFRMTGEMCTDFSYASGSGVYDLRQWAYSPDLIDASGIPADLFPEIKPSTHIVGELHSRAATELGLHAGIPVICGGVDNSCMALGARNTKEGRIYTSLGSSAWIAVSSRDPVIDVDTRPYVFAHVVPGYFTSAMSIFSGGSSFRWVRDVLCKDLTQNADGDAYSLMTEEAQHSPVGANGLLFNPSLAGGTSMDPSPWIRGSFAGLDLRHSRPDLIRSAMEGVALNLGAVLEVLKAKCIVDEEMIVVGGGSESHLWRQILADVFGMNVSITNIGQEAGSLGAAAVAAVGAGIWSGFEKVDDIHEYRDTQCPDPTSAAVYRKLMPIFKKLRESQAELGIMLHDVQQTT